MKVISAVVSVGTLSCMTAVSSPHPHQGESAATLDKLSHMQQQK